MFPLCFSLRHVFTLLGVAVPARARALIDPRSGFTETLTSGFPSVDCTAAEVADGEPGAMAVGLQVQAVWADRQA